SPAKIFMIRIDVNARRAAVYVNPDQRPLAIGKQGQNVRLASQLAGYEIDILDVKDLPAGAGAPGAAGGEAAIVTAPKEHVIKIENLEGLDKKLVAKLAAANLTDVEQLKGLSAKDIASIEGIDEDSSHLIADAVKKVK
ncbi:MAG: KH domain-containing protein, partial [Candidatus Gracilibacteria bacterium]